MAQTTAEVWGGGAKVEISTDGTSYTDISGHATQVSGTTQNRATGEVYTFDGDTAIITGGKLQPLDVTVSTVYTETTTDAFTVAMTEFQTAGGDPLYVRWSPDGGDGGDFQFATGACEITSFDFPEVASDNAGPVLTSFTVRAPSITKSNVAT
jgi:hypothetical protein